VLFTVMGQKYFPVRCGTTWIRNAAQMLGNELAAVRADWSAFIGPLFSAPWAADRIALASWNLYGYLVIALG